MQGLTLDITQFQIEEKRTSHHADLLERFAQRLNPARIAAGYKAYSYARIAMLLQNLTYDMREQLYTKCEKSSNFGKTFNYLVKNHKDI